MTTHPLACIDGVLGRAVELAVEDHHRRRLLRLGHAAVLRPDGDGLWASGDPSPRPGNQLDVLIDGAEALPAIAEALQAARSHIHITGWHLSAHFELVRGTHPVVLGALLAELAQRVDVRVLVWAGAPLPAFHPTRKEVTAEVERLVRDTTIRCMTDPREHPFHCHHEKTIVIDDEVAFVGGIDMTDLAGDRFDVSEHPARRRLGWHDVGTRLRGPAVADVAAHFAMRWRELTGEQLPVPDPPPPAGPSTVHSLMNDTEMNVVTDDREVAHDTRERLWAEHLELDLEEVRAGDPRALVDEHWIPIAQAQLQRERDGVEATRNMIALPGISQRSRRLLGPLAGLIDDG